MTVAGLPKSCPAAAACGDPGLTAPGAAGRRDCDVKVAASPLGCPALPPRVVFLCSTIGVVLLLLTEKDPEEDSGGNNNGAFSFSGSCFKVVDLVCLRFTLPPPPPPPLVEEGAGVRSTALPAPPLPPPGP